METISTFVSELAKCVGEGENGPFVAGFRSGSLVRLSHTKITDPFRRFEACPIVAVAWRLTGRRYDTCGFDGVDLVQAAADIGLPPGIALQIMRAADEDDMYAPVDPIRVAFCRVLGLPSREELEELRGVVHAFAQRHGRQALADLLAMYRVSRVREVAEKDRAAFARDLTR